MNILIDRPELLKQINVYVARLNGRNEHTFYLLEQTL